MREETERHTERDKEIILTDDYLSLRHDIE